MDQAKAGAARKTRQVNNPGASSTFWALKPESLASKMRECLHERDCYFMAIPINDDCFICCSCVPVMQWQAPAVAFKITQIDLEKPRRQTFLLEPRHSSNPKSIANESPVFIWPLSF
jgi:hypothetical protein